MAKRRYQIDEHKILRWLAQGRGSGDGADYKPFFKTRDVPSLGRRSRILGRKSGRLHHLLSDLELAAFLQADWQDDVTDIQEQFPLDRGVTRRIARGMRVRHPCDNRTATDIVMMKIVQFDLNRPFDVRWPVSDLVFPRGRTH